MLLFYQRMPLGMFFQKIVQIHISFPQIFFQLYTYFNIFVKLTNRMNTELSIKELMMMKKETIQITDGHWKAKRIGVELKEYDCWEVGEKLILGRNFHRWILQQISHIHFPYLDKLFLHQNSLSSLEPIINLRAPTLSCLFLYNNKLVNLQPLRRALLPNLKAIELRNNYIKELKCLFQIHAQLIAIALEFYNEKESCSDLSWVMKLKSHSFECLGIRTRERINYKAQPKKMRKRYSGMKVYIDDSI